MRKLILTFATLLCASFLFAQPARFDDLEFFDRLIINGNVSKVIVERGSHGIIIDGAKNDQVDLTRNAGVVTLEITSNSSVEVSVSNSNLKWIEASEGTEIEGVEYLSGGKGIYLVTGREGRYPSDINVGLNVDVGDDFDFDFDFGNDFEIDFDFDVNLDFDYDYAFDFDMEEPEFNWDWDWDWDYDYDVKVKTKYEYNFDTVKKIKRKN